MLPSLNVRPDFATLKPFIYSILKVLNNKKSFITVTQKLHLHNTHSSFIIIVLCGWGANSANTVERTQPDVLLVSAVVHNI